MGRQSRITNKQEASTYAADLARINASIENDDTVATNDDRDTMRSVTCTRCDLTFRLRFQEYAQDRQTLVIRSCPSGGVYDMLVVCPGCGHSEGL